MGKIPWYKSIRYREIGLLVISFLLIIIIITSVLVFQSTRSVRSMLENMERETTTHISTIVESNFSKAKQMLNLHLDSISRGVVSVDDASERDRYFVTVLEQYEDIAMTFVGLPDGSFYGARRMPDGELQIARNNRATSGHSEYYSVDEMGERVQLEQVFENFDPRIRPWYLNAIQNEGIVYSELYSHFVFQEPTITASLAYYDDGELIGVFGVDYLMTWLGEALSDMVIGENGQIVVLGSHGQLVASSAEEEIFQMENGTAVPQTIEESNLDLFKAGWEEFQIEDGSHRFRHQGETYILSSSGLGMDELGWKAYYIIKESDFLSGFQMAITTILFAVLALSGVFVLIMIRSNRKHVNPIMSLNEAALHLQNGSYRKVPEGSGEDEINELIKSFNQMGYRISNQMEILNDEVKRQTRELEKAAEEAQEANNAKSRFLATMSHELRTPLNSFIGMVELLKMTEMNEEQCEYTNMAEKSGYTLLNLINEVLDFSKIEADRIELEEIPVIIRDLKDRVQAVTMPLIKKNDNEFEFSVEKEVPSTILGDPLKLAQILINLVSNASKFTKEGRIEVAVCHVPAVSEDEADKPSMLEFSVRDTGIGMPKEKQEQIFQPFMQVDNSTTRKYGGTGLGLAISKRLVELMDGDIWVESQEGEGSRFVFRIPYHPLDSNSMGDEADRSELIPAGPKRNISVLVVEDDEANAYFMESVGKKEGWMTDVAGNGMEALEKAGAQKYDLIIMDIEIPEMDGIEVTTLIRQGGLNESTPILALTASALGGDEAKCLEAGMDAYMTKPFKVVDLRDIIDKLLEESDDIDSSNR